jgi:hypothetical protein
MAFVLGLNAWTIINIGTLQVPVDSVVTKVRDETLNLTMSLADVTTREANGWRLNTGVLKEASVDAKILYNTSDFNFSYFQAAYFNKSTMLMGFWDGDPLDPASQGLVGSFKVTTFTIGRQLEEAMTVDITFTAILEGEAPPPYWTE